MKRVGLAFGVILTLLLTSMSSAEETPPDFKDSVVKIFASTSAPDINKPWQAQMRKRAIGSGVVIAGGRILTSAHVVAYATFVEVKKMIQTSVTMPRSKLLEMIAIWRF